MAAGKKTDSYPQAILDAAPYPIASVDLRYKILFANKAFRHIEGLIDDNLNALSTGFAKKLSACDAGQPHLVEEFSSGNAVYAFDIHFLEEEGRLSLYGQDISQERVNELRISDIAKFPIENPNPVVRVNSAGEILFANPAARSFDGLIVGHDPESLNQSLINAVVEAYSTREVHQSDLESQDRIYVFTFTPIEGESYVNAYGRDITNERRAQQALLEANNHLERRIADRTASVRLLQNIVLSLNNADSLENAMQAALHEICNYTGWPVGHAYMVDYSEPVAELRPTGIWHIDCDQSLSDLRRLSEKDRFALKDDLPYQAFKRGHAFWIENLIDNSHFPRQAFAEFVGLKSGMAFPITVDEQIIGVLEFFSMEVQESDAQITTILSHVGAQLGTVAKRKQAEAEILKSQQEADRAHKRLTDALEVIGEGFVLYDKDDRMVLFNSKFIEMLEEGINLTPKVGQHYAEVIRANAMIYQKHLPPDEREAWVQKTVMDMRSSLLGDNLIESWNGKWLRAQRFLTQDEGVVSIFTDVTAIKKHEFEMEEMVEKLGVARDEAVRANSAKSQFLANMSHELRTPLNAIIGYSELLMDEADDDGNTDYIPDLEKIQKAGKHLLELINDVLDLSKIEVGKMEVLIEAFDLQVLLGEVESTILPLIQNNENKLIVRKGDDLGVIHSDVTKLRQNLFNLLSNASKFSKNSEIELQVQSCQKDGVEFIEFVVRDQGIGMTQEQLNKIFEPFSQADATTSKEFGGTGLGLTITREFSRKLGGDITVSSEKDVGSVFTMTIMKDGRDIDRQAEQGSVLKAEGVEDAALVLIIDDDPHVRELLQRNLQSMGYHTVTAASGEEGLLKAEEFKPDAITLDVVMPKTDGWATLRALKANTVTAKIPVIMVSIMDEKSMGFSLGASDYLTKPVERDQLLVVLRKLLGQDISRTILVVDDDESVRAVFRRYLGLEGARVIEAENGLVGLQQLQSHRPALILLDLMMPEMDGFEFIDALRSNPEWANIPVVVVTAKTLTKDDRDRLEGWIQHLYEKGNHDIKTVLREVCSLLPDRNTGSAKEKQG